MTHHRRRRTGDYLIAPPGTPADGQGWHRPPPGTTLTWTIEGERPDVAVKRNGVLLASGLPAWTPLDVRNARRQG